MHDPKDASVDDVGQDKQYKHDAEKYDAVHGKYDSPLANMQPDQKVPTLPKAPDPSPFKLGPTGG